MEDLSHQYNTQLSPQEEQQFAAWVGQNTTKERDPSRDLYDYDLKGWWKNNPGEALTEGHLSDQFKKPNHPTFSTESQYHGRDGRQGGAWLQHEDKSWSFRPGATNLQYYGPQGLQEYFSRVEPGNRLDLTGVQ